jgi:integrase/recombinase XerC
MSTSSAAALAAAFSDHLRLNRNVSANTVDAYQSDLSQFLAFAAGHLSTPESKLAPKDLDLAIIRAFMADLYRQGQSRASVARKLSALRSFARFLKREGWIEIDPAALAVSPKREQKVPAHLSVDEMSRLLEVPDVSTPLGRRDRAILELFYASGLRLSELVGLDLEDVDLNGRIVRVMGKGGKERIVPFNTSAQRSLRTWYKDRGGRWGPRNTTNPNTNPHNQRRKPQAQAARGF